MNLKQILHHFIDHRREIIVRRTRFDLAKAEARAHILEGLKIALDNLDQVIKLIRGSANPAEAKELLMAKLSLSEAQAQAILDMRLQRLTGLERDKILAEYREVIKLIAKLKAILNSEELVRQIIREETEEIAGDYGDVRRTEIVAPDQRDRPGGHDRRRGHGGDAEPHRLHQAHPGQPLPGPAPRRQGQKGHGHQGRGLRGEALRGLHPPLSAHLHRRGPPLLAQGARAAPGGPRLQGQGHRQPGADGLGRKGDHRVGGQGVLPRSAT